jgi:hypothetical protein
MIYALLFPTRRVHLRAICVVVSVTLTLFLISSGAQAYIGPGPGIALLGPVFTAVLVTLVSAFALLIFPFRRAYQWWKARRQRARENPRCENS